jgi:hypothetical protein
VAAIDATTGGATAWDPNVPEGVHSLAVNGSTVYLGGGFNTVGGQKRHGLAAVDATTGALTSWDPDVEGGLVDALVVNGSNLYVGGQFTSIGGQPRKLLAAVDLASGVPTSWDPNGGGVFQPTDNVFSMAVSGSTVYAGGQFTSAGGQPRNDLAALDISTGAATAWDPNADERVFAIVPNGPIVYVGGVFHHLGGVVRNTIAAINASNGLPTPWVPNDRQSGINVFALALSGPTLYVGGSFDNFNGQNRNNLVEVDAVTGAVSPWAPDLTANVRTLALNGNTIYAGGDFPNANGLPQSYFAGIANMSVTALEPAQGGNAGPTTLTIYGSHLLSGATVRLSHTGQPDIVAISAEVAIDHVSLTVTLDLTNAAPGVWNVLVVNPDGQTASRPDGFTIEAAEAPQLRVDIVGPTQIMPDQPAAFDLVIENPGNVDALAVPMWVAGIPADAAVALDFPVTPAPQAGSEFDWSQAPQTLNGPGGRYFPVLIPRVSPGTSTFRVELSVPITDPSFQLRAAIAPPWGDGTSLGPCLADGAVITSAACAKTQLAAINSYLLGTPGIEALSGIGAWAKIAWECEGATADVNAAVARGQQVLDFMVQPILQQGSTPGSCASALPPRWLDVSSVSVQNSLVALSRKGLAVLSTGGSIEIDGARGVGASGALPDGKAIPYSIRFRNASNATGSVQRVVIDDALPSTLDLSTVSLGAITFGGAQIDPPSGQSEYKAVAPLGGGLVATVFATLDPTTSHRVWTIQATTSGTDQPPTDPNQGFLPPGVSGSVLFTVKALPLAPGTPIVNSATVAFDGNSPQSTNQWTNGADNTPPASHVLALGAVQGQTNFTVNWVADGAPPDLKDFTIYVSMDNNAYTVWRQNITSTSDVFASQRGHAYSFYSVARDVVGNIEAAPSGPDASTFTTTAVGGTGPARLALAGSWPNPARGSLSVRFALPNRQPAELELLDIAGRRLERREVGPLGPGQHMLAMGSSPRLRPGLYFLRLIAGRVVLKSRVVLIQ